MKPSTNYAVVMLIMAVSYEASKYFNNPWPVDETLLAVVGLGVLYLIRAIESTKP